MKKFLGLILLIPTLTLGQKTYVVQTFDFVILNHSAKSGWGSAFYLEHSLGKRTSAIASIGIVFLGEKAVSSMYPIQLGAKYYFQDYTGEIQKGLFASSELGVHVLKDISSPNGSYLLNETDFSYELGLGYRINKVELSFRQHFIAFSEKTLGYSGLRFAWLLLRRKR